jgi:hypothetical protein
VTEGMSIYSDPLSLSRETSLVKNILGVISYGFEYRDLR